jgi:cytochrome d ubiquinol oxidase subunit I
MFNPATPPQTLHMIAAAFMVAGFGTAGVYAVAMLGGRRDRYHRLGFIVPFTMAAIVTPIQIGLGDYAARFLSAYQPTKLAAAEGLFTTTAHAPLHLGGVAVGGELRYAIEIPSGLSLLVGESPGTVVRGLDQAPVPDRPPVTVVHLAFDAMVALGSALLLLALWFALVWWRRRRLPESRWFLRLAALGGVAAVIAVEAGWTVTEVGRQPWTVYGRLRTSDAVNPAPGLWAGFLIVCAVYAVLTIATVQVLRHLPRGASVAPQEIEPQDGAAAFPPGASGETPRERDR